MTTEQKVPPFTPAHHGLLMAWIARQVFQRVGPVKGEMVVRKAIRHYGEQRGRRMALRVQEAQKELSMLNYFIYGEWSAPGSVQQKFEQSNHHDIRMMVACCPWRDAWAEQDLMEYGRLYCLEIDQALMRGYNPDLHIDVVKTLTNDRQPCDFIFHGTPLNLSNTLRLKLGKKVNPGKRVVLPWEYHTGHLYKAMTEVLISELGRTGREAAEAGLAEFAAAYGADSARVVAEALKIDFNQLPEHTALTLEAKHGYS